MKVVTQSISLSQELISFAKQEAEAQGFSSLSEYFRELLRQRRQARIDEDVAFLEKSMAQAPELREEDVRQIVAEQKRGRKERRGETASTAMLSLLALAGVASLTWAWLPLPGVECSPTPRSGFWRK